MDVSDLYQELIIDHGLCPRNCRAISDQCLQAEGFNPLCGDKVQIFIKIDNEQVKDVSFIGSGCAICLASASLMTEALPGKNKTQTIELCKNFKNGILHPHDPISRSLGKLEALMGVKQFPSRVKCATLPWHTLEAALNQITSGVTTENA